MLTVLIYQKLSQKFIDRYRALFESYEESGQIAFCFWDEHGTDVSSALPELNSIVRGIRQWRAVIVMPQLDNEDEEEPSRPENPFDYLCYEEAEPDVHESNIPLIRLAQMLAGVPLVNKHYSNHRILNDKNQKQMVVDLEEEEEALEKQQKIWNELNDKYSLPCDRPASIFLFKARTPQNLALPGAKQSDKVRRYESDSSLFWYRNRYPARVRFLIQDCARVGNVHYQEDLFRFWMTALTIAVNNFPAGTFEAYKVYHTEARIDFDEVHTLFSKYYNRLSSIQFRANMQIKDLQKSSHMVRQMGELPMYQCEIPVHFELRSDPDLNISSKRIGLSGNCPIQEEPWWYRQVEKSYNAVKKLHSSIKMVLDRASLQCRYASKMTEDEICELDEYQFEEMDQQLSELEKKILTFNTYKALPIGKFYRNLDKEKKSTGSEMRKRMSRKVTILSGIAALIIYLIGFIPDFAYQLLQGNSFGTMFVLAMAGCLIMAGTSLACLMYFRRRVCFRIKKYNDVIYGIIDNYQKAGDTFATYLSDCCSYMRGRFMLQALKKKTLISSEEIVQLGRHVEHLDSQMHVIYNWLSDLDRKPQEDTENHSKDYFDFDIPPGKNMGYSIQMDCRESSIPSVGGSTCRAPYPYIYDFTVKRESLFENKKN